MKIILVITCVLVVTTTIRCTFICDNGEETELLQTCDGIFHCSDGSDETSQLCFHIMCPNNTFRCHYGACVHKASRCDGIRQCVDGSDENQCNKYQVCKADEFKCNSEECISSKKLCDGIEDCNDASDEDSNICVDISCPVNSYHCKFGGCINLSQRCNGNKDCIDGSDESETLCKSLNCTGTLCEIVHEKITCPPIKSTRISVHCEVPLGIKRGIVPCNEPLPIGTIAYYECLPYYIPTSLKHANNKKMVCQSDGTWNRNVLKCRPDCGKADPVALPLIIKGWSMEQGKFPWHANLYALESGNWTFICGASLLTERTVITAAHCTWNLSPETLQVALAKYYTDYSKIEDYTQIRNIDKIIRQPLYQDFIGNYGSDIAILVLEKIVEFSPVILPVCIDWNLDDISNHLKSNNYGLVLGSGLTENEVFSDKVRATFLPVVSDDECIKQHNKDFKKYVTFTSFCAGWTNGTGVCNGDSGGGLVFTKPSNPNVWILQGIVSVSPRRPGTLFCDPKFYTVFTKVGIYVEWIYKVLSEIHTESMHDPFMNNNAVL